MDDPIDSDLEARGFSLRTAYYLAHASHCAYDENGDWLEKLGLDDETTQFTCGEFHGFVGLLDRVAVLAFRGTENLENCLTDALTDLVARPPYPGLVHLGFAEAVEEVWPVVRRLLGPPSQSLPLWVTGHSLGGAMATLASVRLAAEGYTVRAVYTYGSPRPGDRVFQKGYGLTNYRFVNDNDLVPHLPFRWCYKHVGELRLLDEHGHVIAEEAAWHSKKRTLSGKAKRVHRAHRHPKKTRPEDDDFDWLSDHRLAGYLEALEKVLRWVPRRRRPDRPIAPRRGVAIRSRRLDPASRPTPQPPDDGDDGCEAA